MAGAAKGRANRDRERHTGGGNGSSSGETSSSGKATRSARSDGRSQGGRSTTSRRTGYDGPTSRSGSPAPASGSRPSSPRPGSPGPGGRDPATARPAVTDVSRYDMPVEAYSIMRGQEGGVLAPRLPPSKAGQPVKLAVNTFDTEVNLKKEGITVYQYDVLIGNGKYSTSTTSKSAIANMLF